MSRFDATSASKLIVVDIPFSSQVYGSQQVCWAWKHTLTGQCHGVRVWVSHLGPYGVREQHGAAAHDCFSCFYIARTQHILCISSCWCPIYDTYNVHSGGILRIMCPQVPGLTIQAFGGCRGCYTGTVLCAPSKALQKWNCDVRTLLRSKKTVLSIRDDW